MTDLKILVAFRETPVRAASASHGVRDGLEYAQHVRNGTCEAIPR